MTYNVLGAVYPAVRLLVGAGIFGLLVAAATKNKAFGACAFFGILAIKDAISLAILDASKP